MNSLGKLGAFGLGLAVVFAGAVGVGQVTGPETVVAQEPEHAAKGGHGAGEEGEAGAGGHGGHEATKVAAAPPGGLQISQDGYTFVPETTTFESGVETEFRFTVRGPDGRTVTRFATEHEKRLHLIVATRDLSEFQHVHPEQVEPGLWSIPLTLPKAGGYRAYADFRAADAETGVTLGVDLFASGKFAPVELSEPSRTATVGEYTVDIEGELVPGETTQVTLTVSKNGKPVRDLQPYLGAYGHLVALRAGDLAYLHVHPEGTPGDGETEPGPRIVYQVEVPSEGRYRLFLDFRHADVVRTAAFTAEAGETTDRSNGPSEQSDDSGHGHQGEHQ